MFNTRICLTTNVLRDRLVWNSFLLLVGAVLFKEIPSKGRVRRNLKLRGSAKEIVNKLNIAPAFYRFWMV